MGYIGSLNTAGTGNVNLQRTEGSYIGAINGQPVDNYMQGSNYNYFNDPANMNTTSIYQQDPTSSFFSNPIGQNLGGYDYLYGPTDNSSMNFISPTGSQMPVNYADPFSMTQASPEYNPPLSANMDQNAVFAEIFAALGTLFSVLGSYFSQLNPQQTMQQPINQEQTLF